MQRSRHLFELIFLLALVSGLAYLYRPQPKPSENANYAEICRQLDEDWRQGHLDQCLTTCNQLLSREPGELMALRYLGMVYLRRGDAQKARELFDRGLQADGEFATVMYGQRLGRLCLERGRLNVAQKQWAKACKDAERAQDHFYPWNDEYELARDLEACAQYGAGNVTEAQSLTIGSANNQAMNELLRLHQSKLTGEPLKDKLGAPLWHAQPCPLCSP
jgi:tetratricopeptide (TPR) repeat protein